MATLPPSFSHNPRSAAESASQSSDAHLEQKLSAIFSRAAVGLSEVSLDGCFQQVNDELCRVLGRSRSELLVSSIRDVTYPEDVPKSLEAFRQLLETGERISLDKRYLRPDGTVVWANSTLTRLDDEQGCPNSVLVVTVDLSDRHQIEEERRQAEEQLRESEERYRAIVNQAITGIAYTELSGRLTLVNQKYCDITGYTAEELSQLRMQDITHPDDLPHNIELYSQMLAEGTPFEIEKRYIRKDKSIVWVNNHVSLIRDRYGNPQSAVAIVLDITARKQIDLMLRDSEAQFRSMADHAPFMVWVTDFTGYCTYLSQSWYDFTGQAQEAALGFGWMNGIHADDREEVEQTFLEANRHREAFRLEYRLRRNDGQYIWVIGAATPQFDRNSQFKGFIGSVIDINDRKTAESALRRSEERYRTLFESIDEGFCIIELLFDENDKAIDYRFLEVNPAFAQQSGLLHAAGKRIRELVPNNEEYWFEIYGRVALTGEAVRLEERTAGLNRWFEVYAFRVGQPEKRHVGVVFKDITERMRAEAEREQLLSNERHYTKQLQGLTVAALAINAALSVEDVLQVITNQAAFIVGAHQCVTSLTVNSDSAQVVNAVYLSDKYAWWRNCTEVPSGSGIYAYICQVNHPLRMTQAELEAHPDWKNFNVKTSKHPPLRGCLAAPLVGRDGQNIGLIQLSDRHEGDFTKADESILVQLAQMASVAVENARLYEAEQQARAAAEASREEAQAANRVKDEFLAVLSHELRSPLNPILGWSTLLQNNKLNAEKTAHALSTIQRNAKLQAELIEDLLDVSRILRGKLSLNVAPVHLIPTIEAAIETVRLAAEAKSIQIRTYLDATVGQVLGDATRLQQIVWNLLSNAVKFTPTGGRVEVRLEQIETQERGETEKSSMASPPSHSTSYAQIIVSDTGKGIEPDFLPYVFDYFRQANAATTRKFGGLGLGLAIVRHLVELHGGTIYAESPGEELGATFTLRLPLIPVQLPLAQSYSSQKRMLDLKGIRILVVDDDADTRDFTSFLLGEAGAAVTATVSAHDACAALAQSQFDILLSDIGMPEMDGYSLLQQVRALPPDQGGQIPAIALTAYAAEFDQQQALRVGFQRHLAKPVDPETLIRAIADLVNRRPH